MKRSDLADELIQRYRSLHSAAEWEADQDLPDGKAHVRLLPLILRIAELLKLLGVDFDLPLIPKDKGFSLSAAELVDLAKKAADMHAKLLAERKG